MLGSDANGLGWAGEADSSLADAGGRQLQAAAAADGQLTSPAGIGGSRRRLHAPTHHHTPAYHAHWLKPHAHTPAYFAKKAAIAARAGAGVGSRNPQATRVAAEQFYAVVMKHAAHALCRWYLALVQSLLKQLIQANLYH